uniref:Protein FAR1-RELATED SEQUENCE n=1 Tax=Chenopodium quinoa TaxID=63459 RepID=A0A803N3U3_CHEQI
MALADEVLFLSGEEGELQDDEEMLQGNQQMVELHAEGSGDSGGYCTPDEQEEKGDVSMVNMDCVREGFGVVLAQSAYKIVQGVKVKRATTWKCDCFGIPDTRKRIARKRLSRELEGEPELKKVELKHTNHIPTPSKALFVPKYRMAELEIVPYVRRRLEFGDDVEREMWIPAAMKHMFWAGMKTMQRSESIHNFFDEFFDKNTGLCDFAERYVSVMEHRMDAERLAYGNSVVYLCGLVTDFKIEETFRNIYTDAKLAINVLIVLLGLLS